MVIFIAGLDVCHVFVWKCNLIVQHREAKNLLFIVMSKNLSTDGYLNCWTGCLSRFCKEMQSHWLYSMEYWRNWWHQWPFRPFRLNLKWILVLSFRGSDLDLRWILQTKEEKKWKLNFPSNFICAATDTNCMNYPPASEASREVYWIWCS